MRTGLRRRDRRDRLRAPRRPARGRGRRRRRRLRPGRAARRRETSTRAASGSRSSARSPTSSRSAPSDRRPRLPPALRQAPDRLSRTGIVRPNRLGTAMLQLVNVGRKSLADYATIASRGLMDEIRRLAEPLAGQAGRPSLGDRVRRRRRRDQLRARPADEGRRPRRRVADHPRRGRVLRRHEDDPQRAPGRPARGLTEEQQEIFRRYNALNAEEFEDDYDYVIVHDPQPAAMIDHFRDSPRTGSGAATSTSRRRTRTCSTFLAPSLERYDAAIFHMREYVPKDVAPAARRSSGRRRSIR